MTRWLLFTALVLNAQELPPVSGLPHPVVLRRIQARNGWDLVVALSDSFCEPAPHPCWWNTKDRLAILLQSRANSEQIAAIALEPGPNDDCSTRVDRITAQELVMSCTGEKWATYDNQVFTYDLAARKLLGHYSYPPFAVERTLPGPQFLMAAGSVKLAVEIDPATGDPRVANTTPLDPPEESAPTFGGFRLVKRKSRYGEDYFAIEGGGKSYPLPQTRKQPDDDPFNETIGPHQVDGNLFWFGITFYDGEGWTGTGGFGYFDAAIADYRLFRPSEIVAWSVSSILVEPDAVWLALQHRGEYGNYPGGLLRWDRNTETVRHWDVPSVANSIVRTHGAIYLGLTNGIATLRGDRIVSFFVDRSPEGEYRIVARN